ncbi:ArnT family glycosyltransferase [Hellea balneolensis]|uniref:ArnT family glycosyltransferase n=1 Tax=Hellea balneolensis TaxID=287478 RepID=UPI0004057607|nr:glycosyltransferase family 39 protein [Hellea balneolensis]
MSSPAGIKAQRLKHIIALLLLSLLVFLPGLSSLPVIDRDEARFAQASVQMAESGDLMDIRFQDQTRYKKPAGIYWLQTAAIKVFAKDGERKIWAQRLPSVLGALLAVLATYWAAARMIGRRGAFIAAAMLAVSALVIFEAHIAKTDAMLAGLGACCFGALAHMRHGGGRKSSWVFWIALGLSIMIKGPVVPILCSLTLITLALWERRNGWMKLLLNLPAILVFILIWVPWTIAIWLMTDGAFFVESLGKDFGGKLISAQERHPGPPGYYLGTIWLTLWPGCLLLLPAFDFAIRAVRNGKGSDAPVVKGMRLCLSWVVPYWILIELMPTKLPHYALPLFPALCVMAGVAAVTLLAVREFSVLRRINAALFLIISAVLIAAVMAGQALYGQDGTSNSYLVYGIGSIAGLCAIIASFALWQSKMKLGLISAFLAALVISVPTYSYILPGLTQLRTADKMADILRAEGIKLPRHGGPAIVSPHFTEPSLVYRLGTSIDVTDKADLFDMATLEQGRVIILDQKRDMTPDIMANILNTAELAGLCLKTTQAFKGFNYSKGDPVELITLRASACPK